MTREKFLHDVAERASLPNQDDAAKVVKATLQTLGERIVGGEARDLAAQLPDGVKDGLLDTAGGDADAESFPADEFVHRVATRLNTDEDRARALAETVFSVLEETVTLGELQDVSGQLTDDYAGLLTGVR